MKPVFTVCVAAALLTVSALADDTAQRDARIPFANLGGIRDWSADGDRAIYIQASSGNWYRAELLGRCLDLPFANRVGFVAEPASGAFTRFSSILVRGRECAVRSLTPSAPPSSKAKHWKDMQGAAPPEAPAK
jgi:hypothetical protein